MEHLIFIYVALILSFNFCSGLDDSGKFLVNDEVKITFLAVFGAEEPELFNIKRLHKLDICEIELQILHASQII